MGWSLKLKEHSPDLDLTRSQTRSQPTNVQELRVALLTTLRAVATITRTHNLEVTSAPAAARASRCVE